MSKEKNATNIMQAHYYKDGYLKKIIQLVELFLSDPRYVFRSYSIELLCFQMIDTIFEFNFCIHLIIKIDYVYGCIFWLVHIKYFPAIYSLYICKQGAIKSAMRNDENILAPMLFKYF